MLQHIDTIECSCIFAPLTYITTLMWDSTLIRTCTGHYFFICVSWKDISGRFILEMWNAKVLVLPIFIVSYGFAKCIREIIRGRVI